MCEKCKCTNQYASSLPFHIKTYANEITFVAYSNKHYQTRRIVVLSASNVISGFIFSLTRLDQLTSKPMHHVYAFFVFQAELLIKWYFLSLTVKCKFITAYLPC